MRKLFLTAFLGISLSLPAHAVQGVNDYNVFMMRDFTGAGCPDKLDEQWSNYNDFIGEMNHVASCWRCRADSDYLDYYLATYWIGWGHNADLIAVDTHGHDEGTLWDHIGWIANRQCVNFTANGMGPTDDEFDNWIYLLNVCDIYGDRFAQYPYNNITLYYTFRNLHRTGAPISVGCWGLCGIAKSWYSTTWNEIGDSIADNGESIWTAWKDGHTVMYHDDPINTMGSGSNADGLCAWHSNSTTWRNRFSHAGPYYPYNYEPTGLPGDPQFCGYYTTL
jgi:hypothetical protein